MGFELIASKITKALELLESVAGNEEN